MSSRYPLDRLAAVRTQRAAGSALELAESLRELRGAEDALAAAGDAYQHAQRAAATPILIDGGRSPAWAVARQVAYVGRLRDDQARARDVVTMCEEARVESLARVDSAQDRATSTRAENEVLARHRAGWERDQRRMRERRED